MVATQPTLVRRAEQRTGPNVHYLGVEPVMLEPGASARATTYIWSDRPAHKSEPWPSSLPLEADTRVVLDAGHKVEWGWHVAAYLVTKGIAAGAAMLAPFGARLGLQGAARDYAPEVLALVFTAVTTFLLVVDLARPKLFLTLLTRPNTKSWLVKGAWILMAFSATVPLAIALRWLDQLAAADALRWINAVLGLGVAGYTAYLFRQCEGRDLWQEKSLLPHLLVQAVLCGSAMLLVFTRTATDLAPWFVISLALHLAFISLERMRTHATANARQAAAFLPLVRMGTFKKPYQFGTVAGTALPVALVALANLEGFGGAAPVLYGLAAVIAVVGLFLYKYAYVRAAQLPPLS
jgi:formate-dependent nitrite reductase membrane component NrfD